MVVYTTQELDAETAKSVSTHLYEDCHVLNKLRRHYSNLVLHTYTVVE